MLWWLLLLTVAVANVGNGGTTLTMQPNPYYVMMCLMYRAAPGSMAPVFVLACGVRRFFLYRKVVRK